ncbi:1-phosphatidylinositol-3-phosphate 5-kinase [Rhizophlyctis rosea]|nr:1-phosphatidylinositol-3-phosphate 5-kinase [Rhizophlyctis rosea]
MDGIPFIRTANSPTTPIGTRTTQSPAPPTSPPKVIVDVALEIAQDLPYVLEILGRNSHRNHQNSLHHVITVVAEPGGSPHDSHYVPGGSDHGADSNKSDAENGLGATLILHGAKRDLDRLEKAMELIIFVVCNLKLEMYLFRDHFALRNNVPTIDSSIINGHTPVASPIPVRKAALAVGKSVWDLFRWGSSNSIVDVPRSRSSSSSTLSGDADHSTPEIASQPLSARNHNRETLNSSNRFDRAIKQIEKTIISASPGVIFPPPHLLVRLRNEEMEFITHTSNVNATLQKDDRRVSYMPADVEFPAVNVASQLNMAGAFPTRALSPPPETYRHSTLSPPISPPPIFDADRKRHSTPSVHPNRISVDSKAGLGYLMTNNNSLTGVMKHQSITFAFTYFHRHTSTIPCKRPEIVTVEYYRKDAVDHKNEGSNDTLSDDWNTTDRSLGEYVLLLCKKASGTCSDETCGRAMGGHIITYTHGHRRVNVCVERVPSPSETSPATQPLSNNEIYTWTSCAHCRFTTTPIPISDGTYHYSFAKYLELLFYHPQLKPSDACECIRREGSEGILSARRCWRVAGLCVVFSVEEIELFEMRVPRWQVVPEWVTKTRNRRARVVGHALEAGNGKAGNGGVTVHTVEEEPDYSLVSATKGEITAFYASAIGQISVLQARVSMIPAQEGLAQVMADMVDNLREEQGWLCDVVWEGMEKGEMNNVRRRVGERVKEIVATVEEWKSKFGSRSSGGGGGMTDPGAHPQTWCIPEYCTLSKHQARSCHVFPTSSVIVRDEEPTSMIAFMLDSKDFYRKLERVRVTLREREGDGDGLVGGGGGGVGGNGVGGDAHTDWTAVEGDCKTKVKVFGGGEGGVRRGCHAKYKWQENKHTYYCTTYFLDEFAELRRKCGVEENFVRSLSRCTRWDVGGGKSRVGFYKTSDDLLVVKQLAVKWTIVEKDALLMFAPRYFEYMGNSDKNPTILAKIFGFYTIKQKNLQTGQVVKMDVLIMEHLFAGVKVSRKFDLKGIPDRHCVTRKQLESGVMWDGEWEDGRYKQLLKLHAHSKKIIQESVWNDTEFLCEANVMDYSLLVGVNDERKELVVGIVDFIGPYTWYKKLESRGKTTLMPLRGGKEVTVLPPDRYRDRFRKAMDENFLMVPDKWIKVPSQEAIGKTRKLPSIL